MTLSISIADLNSFNPCNCEPANKLEELWAGRERVTALEVLDFDMSDEHKYWVILRPELLEEAQLAAIKSDLLDLITDKESDIYLKTVDAPCFMAISRSLRFLQKPYEEMKDVIMGIVLKHIS